MFDDLRDDRSASEIGRLGIVAAVVIAFGAGYVAGNEFGFEGVGDPFESEQALSVGAASQPEEFEVFWEAWQLVDDNFFFEVPDASARTEGAIGGMLSALDDQFTRYIPPDAAELLREVDSGQFEGIGAFVGEAEDGGVKILRLFDDGPAVRAGMLAEDVIVAVDGNSIEAFDLDAALMLVRGPANSDVTLTVLRDGVEGPFDIVVRRGRLDVPTTEARMLDGNVGYVLLFDFNQQANRRLRRDVNDLLEQGAEAIVLDLRDNPGGFLDQAVDVADLFLPQGEVLTQRGIDGQSRSHRSNNGDAAESIPLVVLINGGSASASEIVAGAIQDLERGVLIGEQTFGKGSVQLQFDLSDGGLLRVTTAGWFTPNGDTINGVGITPDVEIIIGEDDESDPQLDAALDYLSEQIVDSGQ